MAVWLVRKIDVKILTEEELLYNVFLYFIYFLSLANLWAFSFLICSVD